MASAIGLSLGYYILCRLWPERYNRFNLPAPNLPAGFSTSSTTIKATGSKTAPPRPPAIKLSMTGPENHSGKLNAFACKLAVGIDLGTTFSAVCVWMNRAGQ